MAEDRLDKLKARQAELAARIRREENRKRLQDRKDDTRRKVLAGAAVLDEAERKPEFKSELSELLGRFLTRADDRSLFALPALSLEKADLVRAEMVVQSSVGSQASIEANGERMAG